MESLLNCELPPVVKTTSRLPSPTFPIPGSSEPSNKENEAPIVEDQQPAVTVESTAVDQQIQDVEEEKVVEDTKQQPVLYYTPDDEEMLGEEDVKETLGSNEEAEVPPFNNPVYPSSSYSSLTSAIGKL